jgi:hypothetical protein
VAFRDNLLLNAREVRGTSELPFAIDAIARIVCDFNNYTKLLPDVIEARLVDGTIPADYEIYLRYAPRYLVVAARDVVVRVRADAASEERAGCSWSESEGRVEPRKGTVRMPLLRGSWTIERIDAGRSRVTYQVAARPGGRIPAWLVRRGAVSALPDVISRLRDELGQAFRSNPAITNSTSPSTPRTTFHVLIPPIVGTTARTRATIASRIPTDMRFSAGGTPLHYTS